MCLLLSKLQAPIQAALRPGVWLPGIRALHQRYERWQSGESPYFCFDKVLFALQIMETSDQLEIYKVDREHLALQIFFYTKNCKWLDVVELEFQAAPESGTFVSARSFSSGFLPAWIPFAFLLNMVCCFIPFFDLGENESRLERIREAADIGMTVNEWGSNSQPV
ncbi:uncharacterized protein LOC135683954 [Rhopilema esculentum]|uniref:uncharacterized protein LOC135683954 n=1 Tax=Rhopilema esculentum TaxID=499914 RepID=UPI0031DACD38|eukprot:gene15290-6502_t